jgi:hypothetical protein
LGSVLDRAEKDKLDLISYSPRQETHTWWEKAVIPLVFQQLEKLYPFDRVNDPGDPLAAANGQYILIRRTVYEAVGAHRAVRNQVVEDVELATLVKRSGYRIWFGPGQGVVSARMYRRFGDMWEGWKKNLYPLYNQDAGAFRRAFADLGCRYVLPAVAGAAFTAAWGGWTAGAGMGLLGYLAWEHTRYWRKLPVEDRLLSTLLLVPGALLVLLLLWESAAVHRRGGVVSWKKRKYTVAPEGATEWKPVLPRWLARSLPRFLPRFLERLARR